MASAEISAGSTHNYGTLEDL